MTKYSPDLVDKICGYIREGLTYKDAATLTGISRETIHTWLNTKPDFSDAVDAALIWFKKAQLQNITVNALRNWQAASYLLAVKFPDEYNPKQEVSVKQEVTHKEESDVSRFLKEHPEVTEGILDDIEQGLGGGEPADIRTGVSTGARPGKIRASSPRDKPGGNGGRKR